MEKLLNEIKKNSIMNINNKYNLIYSVLEKIYSIYQFNKFEYIISHLIGTNTITLSQYIDLHNKYLERNKYLYIFEITELRSFREKWQIRCDSWYGANRSLLVRPGKIPAGQWNEAGACKSPSRKKVERTGRQ